MISTEKWVCFIAIEKSFKDGVSVKKPQRARYMFNLSGYFHRSQDNNLPAHILLRMLEETRTEQPKEWKVSLPRVPG